VRIWEDLEAPLSVWQGAAWGRAARGSSRLLSRCPAFPSLTPLAAPLLQGEVCDIDGKCVDAAEDEMFRLTTKEGKFSLEREVVRTDTPDFDSNMIFEQDPVQILDALLPLYMNSQVLRALQVSLGAFAHLMKTLLRGNLSNLLVLGKQACVYHMGACLPSRKERRCSTWDLLSSRIDGPFILL
jgi:hypothetical protein